MADFSGRGDLLEKMFGEPGMMANFFLKPNGDIIWVGHWGITWTENRFEFKGKIDNPVLNALKKLNEDPDYDFTKGIPSGEEVTGGEEEEVLKIYLYIQRERESERERENRHHFCIRKDTLEPFDEFLLQACGEDLCTEPPK